MERGGQEGEKILNVFQKLEMRLKCTVCNNCVKLGQGKKTYVKQFEFYSRNIQNPNIIILTKMVQSAMRAG